MASPVRSGGRAAGGALPRRKRALSGICACPSPPPPASCAPSSLPLATIADLCAPL